MQTLKIIALLAVSATPALALAAPHPDMTRDTLAPAASVDPESSTLLSELSQRERDRDPTLRVRGTVVSEGAVVVGELSQRERDRDPTLRAHDMADRAEVDAG